ncbi:PKD domain-containing protein [Owenweeksia hongkongensis]|uniref:PKD domain-containing protein n=1 Tax=Owenweeksia hongkongensis TaxID=253245 RepID=UPI003A8F97E0
MKSTKLLFTFLVFCTLNFIALSQNCQIKKAPFFENFDKITFSSGTAQNGGSIDSCWQRSSANTYYWRVGPASSRTPNTGPQNDHTTGNGKYMFTEINGINYYPITTELKSPLIDLDTLNNPKLTFFTHLFGLSIASFKVHINNGSGWNLEYSITGPQQSSRADAWDKVTINLSSYLGDTIQVRFTGEKVPYAPGPWAETDMSIDDFRISNDTACETPQNLTISFETDVKAGIKWISGGANNWNVSYGPTGTSAQNGILINIATPHVILSGLTPSSSYDVYVRDSCAPGQVSSWFGPISFITDCSPVLAPFIENFDSANFSVYNSFPPCWKRKTTGGDFYFLARQGPTFHPSTGPSGDHTTGNGRYVFSVRSGGSGSPVYGAASFKTPLLDLSNLTKPSLSFWYHMYGADIDSMAVFVESKDVSKKVLSLIGQQQFSNTDAWKEMEIDLSGFKDDTIEVAFTSYKYALTGTKTNVAIDDIAIEEAPICPKPYVLHAEKITGTSVTLGWSAATPSSWQLKYRPTASSGAFTFISTANNPTTINGLSPRTEYEFYVRDSCIAPNTSQWVGPLVITTDCPLYNIPFYENFDSTAWVPGVSLSNIGNEISLCWNRPDSLAPHFGVMTGATTSTSTGPANGSGGTGKYIYTEASGTNYPATGEITSPQIYINPLRVNPRLRFGYHMYGSDITSLEVEVGNENGFTNVHTFTGAQQTSSTAPWKYHLVSLAQFSGDTIQVKFKGNFSGFNGDVAIDDFLVTAKHCPLVSTSFTDSIHFLQANFVLDSTNSNDSLYWDFGDGTDTSIVNSSHVYDTAGTYTVKLLAYNNCGNVDSTIKTITVCDSLWADFNITQVGDTVIFTANPTPGQTIYYWDLGNGKDTVGSEIKYSYQNHDSVKVGLTVVNICGDSVSLFKVVRLCLPPEALWSYHIVSTTSSGMKVQFDGTNSKNAVIYHWSFGDGDTAIGAMPLHTYVTPGLHYKVILTVKNRCDQQNLKSGKLSEIGLPELKLESLLDLFPNPSNGKFTLTWTSNEVLIKSIQLIDISGNPLYRQEINKEQNGIINIDVSQIPKGNYVLKIQTLSGIVNKPVVISP